MPSRALVEEGLEFVALQDCAHRQVLIGLEIFPSHGRTHRQLIHRLEFLLLPPVPKHREDKTKVKGWFSWKGFETRWEMLIAISMTFRNPSKTIISLIKIPTRDLFMHFLVTRGSELPLSTPGYNICHAYGAWIKLAKKVSIKT